MTFSNGTQQSSGGVLAHNGPSQFAGGYLQVTGAENNPSESIIPKVGTGVELLFIHDSKGAQDGYGIFQAYSRETSTWRDLHISGKSIVLTPTGGSVTFNGGSVTFNGDLTVTGVVSASGFAGGYVNGSSLNIGGRGSFAMATPGVGSAGGSEGQIEVNNNGSGAAKIAFHRSGAYAAYLGLDTDNQWCVGGWSMGAARYVLITDSQAQTLTNKIIKWRYDYNTSGVMSYYNCFYVLPVNGGVWTVPPSAGHAGEMIIIKNWAGAAGTIQCPGGSVFGTIPGGVSSITMQPGDSYTLMSDGGAGWMVV